MLWSHKLLKSPFSLGMGKEKPSPSWSSPGQEPSALPDRSRLSLSVEEGAAWDPQPKVPIPVPTSPQCPIPALAGQAQTGRATQESSNHPREKL